MNITIQTGRICNDLTLQVRDDTKYIRFTLAVNADSKDGTTDFIDYIAFGKMAETMHKYLHKGDEILVQGKMNGKPYVNKNGEKRKTSNISVSSIKFLDTRQKEETTASPPPLQQKNKPVEETANDEAVDDEEIPNEELTESDFTNQDLSLVDFTSDDLPF